MATVQADDDELKEQSLDDVIFLLTAIRKKVGKNMPLRYADGYDHALGVYCISVEEEETHWDGAPDESFVCLS